MIIWLSMSTGASSETRSQRRTSGRWGISTSTRALIWWLAAIHMCCRGLSCIMENGFCTVWEILCSEARFQETMLVQASVDAQGETALSIVPATSSAGYTRELDVGKKEAFYQKIQGLSDGVQIDENGKVQVQ